MSAPGTPSERQNVTVFWFRRDLRIHDNAGLSAALKADNPILPLFIFDSAILQQLPDRHDRRVQFIHSALTRLQASFAECGGRILVCHGRPLEVFSDLLKKYNIKCVYANHDYEPYAIHRDSEIGELLRKRGVEFKTFKDQVVFEKNEVSKDDGKPYTIFTPYSRKWKAKLTSQALQAHASEKELPGRVLQISYPELPSLKEIGFERSSDEFPSHVLPREIVRQYAQRRDFPALSGTSRLGVHLRFGTVSVRELVKAAQKLSETWLNELIWREFFMMMLYQMPHTVAEPCRPDYRFLKWRNNQNEFKAWCEGRTGYPIVDAGMRELNATGFMHNRVRMITASFLVKHLLIDWKWGEAYFAQKLLDYEQASNVGNWQWVAGTGCDAAPYFRIFNPKSQTLKFDKKEEYIRKWVPEVHTSRYPEPIVQHEKARERTLLMYKQALAKARAT